MNTADIYEDFQGRPPRKVSKIRLAGQVRGNLDFAKLGILIGLAGRVYCEAGKRHYGYHLAIPRGDQAVLLADRKGVLHVFDFAGGFTPVPEIRSLTYYTDKGDQGGAGYYTHAFKKFPRLDVLAGSEGCLARLVGGAYTINERGIVG